MQKVKIIADSTSPEGVRLTTFWLTYWRAIHSEIMTYRMWSRISSSSRLIPNKNTIDSVFDDPFIPGSFNRGEQLIWLNARENAMGHATNLTALGVPKQYTNRLLEPFNHITTIVTATEWKRFFDQRISKSAQPEICDLAIEMRDAMSANVPRYIEYGYYHLPFVSDEDRQIIDEIDQIRVSTARIARVCYNKVDKKTDVDSDIRLYQNLLEQDHMTPFEHQAMAVPSKSFYANLRAWKSERWEIENSIWRQQNNGKA